MGILRFLPGRVKAPGTARTPSGGTGTHAHMNQRTGHHRTRPPAPHGATARLLRALAPGLLAVTALTGAAAPAQAAPPAVPAYAAPAKSCPTGTYWERHNKVCVPMSSPVRWL